MENRILPAENEVVSERERLCRWLEDEAEDRMKQAISRSEMAKSTRGATAKELRAAKMLAEQMAGHPLRGVSTDPADADRESDIQDRIAAKLEKEARLLSKWADLLRTSESSESRLAELQTSLPRTPAEVDAADPEEFCKQCLRPNISWFVRSDLWNRVMRRGSQPEPIICPVCFVKRAEMQRVEVTGWQLVPEDYDELQQKAEILAAASAQGQGAVEKSAGGQEPQKTTPKRSENQSLLLVELNELLKRFDISGGKALERTLEEHARWKKSVGAALVPPVEKEK